MTNQIKIVGATIAALFALGVVACGDASSDEESRALEAAGQLQHEYSDLVDGPHADHEVMHLVTLGTPEAARQHFFEESEGVGRFEYPDPFYQVGLQLDAQSVDGLSYRAQREDGTWTGWRAVEVYWSEGIMHNGHIVLEMPAEVVELRGLSGVEFAQIEFFEEVAAREVTISGEDDSVDLVGSGAFVDDDDIRTVQQAVAPSSMVTTRSQWNAISPSKICGSVVNPYRMSIHHTASPSSDGGDPGARMRGMQSYHINTRGWCDIGYHFVVAQSGEILQGRSRSNRPAAHVGGQNSGNVGISMIGNYGSSTPPNVQLENVAKIVHWVHETHNIPLNRDAIRGHREWPGQTTSCPGNQGLNQLNDIIDRAGSIGKPDAPPPPPPPEYDAEISLSIVGLDDFYHQGTSDSVPDAFEGAEFRAEIVVTNDSSDPIREVTVGYAFDVPGLKATNYRIESDHPAYDQTSWELNSANDDSGNPSAGDLGQEGVLIMHAFSPNESKRIVIDMEASQYNIGFDDFAGVRTWVRRIEDVYGVQNSYGGSPDTNHIGGILRAQSRVDVLSQAEWQFQAGETDDIEGWVGKGAYEQLKLNTNDDALALKAAGAGASLVAPSWTRIDADQFDEMVIRTRSHDGGHIKALYWAANGEGFSEERTLRFMSEGDGEYHTMVIPVGEHPEWRGEITNMKLVQLVDRSVDDDDSGWYDLDHLYFQDRHRGETSSHTLEVVEVAPVDIRFQAFDDAESGSNSIGSDQSSGFFPGGGDEEDTGRREVHSGCSATGDSSAPTSGWMFAVFVLAGMAIRRRQPAA